MIIRPIYNILLLPDVSYYFKKDFFSGFGGESIETGSDILFIFLKNDREDNDYTPDDFYPIGLAARAEGFGEEDAVSVRTLHRVDISDLEISDSGITAAASIRAEAADMTEGEEKQQFARLRSALLKFVQGYQWGALGKELYPAEKKHL